MHSCLGPTACCRLYDRMLLMTCCLREYMLHQHQITACCILYGVNASQNMLSATYMQHQLQPLQL